MSFSVTELRILTALDEGKTLAEIGEELFLHQPAVSRALRLAQARTDLQLVERVGRRLQLTTAGKQLADSARLVLQGLLEVDFLTDRLRDGHTGTVRILAAHTPANYVIPGVIGTFMAKYPDVDVSLREASSSDIWQSFCEGPFDLAVAPTSSLPRQARSSPLYSDRLSFYVGATSPLAGRREIGLAALRETTLIGPFFQPHWSELWERVSSKGLVVGRRMDLVVGEGVKRLVGSGVGVGMLYRSAINDDIERGDLVELICPEISESISYSVVRRPVRSVPAVDTFNDLLFAAAAALDS